MAKFKDKERILKAAREKITYKGIATRVSADFSIVTLQARREWQNTFRVLKGKSLQPKIVDSERLSFRIGGEIKNFSEKKKNTILNIS